MVTLLQYLNGRDSFAPLTVEQLSNAENLIEKINRLEVLFGETLFVTSGYRPPQINQIIQNAAPKSTHLSCEGIDLRDRDGDLGRFLMENHGSLLLGLGLYMEHPDDSKDHIHLQTRPPKSGSRIFRA